MWLGGEAGNGIFLLGLLLAYCREASGLWWTWCGGFVPVTVKG